MTHYSVKQVVHLQVLNQTGDHYEVLSLGSLVKEGPCDEKYCKHEKYHVTTRYVLHPKPCCVKFQVWMSQNYPWLICKSHKIITIKDEDNVDNNITRYESD